jgi:DNA-binding CsgD family transcriptional regulator
MEPATPSLQTDYAWTPRQREVLALIAAGRTNGEIADLLQISLSGAKWHVTEILSKLGVESREEAADYWRRYNRLAQRVRRAVHALTGVSLFAKAAAGTTGVFALGAATVLSLGMLASDGTSPAAAATAAPTPSPATVPVCDSGPKLADYVITASASGNGHTLFAYGGDTGRRIYCVGLWAEKNGVVEGGITIGGADATHILILPGVFRGACPAPFAGYVTGGAVAVRATFADGTTIVVPANGTSPSMPADVRFFSVAAPCEPWPGKVESLDAAGNVVDSQDMPDPRAFNPDYRSSPPTAAAFEATGQGEPGTRGGANGLAFAVDPAGARYEFTVTHTGTLPLRIIPWCATGTITPAHVSGPTDAGGSGVIALDVPPGNVACFFMVTGADGDWRIAGR